MYLYIVCVLKTELQITEAQIPLSFIHLCSTTGTVTYMWLEFKNSGWLKIPVIYPNISPHTPYSFQTSQLIVLASTNITFTHTQKALWTNAVSECVEYDSDVTCCYAPPSKCQFNICLIGIFWSIVECHFLSLDCTVTFVCTHKLQNPILYSITSQFPVYTLGWPQGIEYQYSVLNLLFM